MGPNEDDTRFPLDARAELARRPTRRASGASARSAGAEALRPNTTHYLMKDRLGSIISILDSNETLKTTYSYDAFGEPIATYHSGQVDCMYRFTGAHGTRMSPRLYIASWRLRTCRARLSRRRDAQAAPRPVAWERRPSAFYRARYYNQSLGRFFSRDPIFSLQSLYAYCNNSPTNFTDPMGLYMWETIPWLPCSGTGADASHKKANTIEKWYRRAYRAAQGRGAARGAADMIQGASSGNHVEAVVQTAIGGFTVGVAIGDMLAYSVCGYGGNDFFEDMQGDLEFQGFLNDFMGFHPEEGMGMPPDCGNLDLGDAQLVPDGGPGDTPGGGPRSFDDKRRDNPGYGKGGGNTGSNVYEPGAGTPDVAQYFYSAPIPFDPSDIGSTGPTH